MSACYSIGQLARASGVSRTTLLYYEKRGLLIARARSTAGYRQYGAADLARLRQLLAYRATGLSLAAIATLLAGGDLPALASERLGAISDEMAFLRQQQALLVRLANTGTSPAMDRDSWSALFRAAGMDDAAMWRWHRLFEQSNPQAHQAFLASLGMDPQEVARVRAASA
ncbi:MAG TPA: MerR family transcriptional regulator [Telluria sp.]|jgi:DNA-binding transcriptional MerR regulator